MAGIRSMPGRRIGDWDARVRGWSGADDDETADRRSGLGASISQGHCCPGVQLRLPPVLSQPSRPSGNPPLQSLMYCCIAGVWVACARIRAVPRFSISNATRLGVHQAPVV